LKILILIFGLFFTLSANIEDSELKKMIGEMIIIGFDAQYVDENSQIIKDINRYNIGGAILFDKNYKNPTKIKNISSPKQLHKLVSSLQKLTDHYIFISIDQEGGAVQRLKSKYGFETIPSAKDMALMDENKSFSIYESHSQMLQNIGINMNFAPVVDLAINPKNSVIVGLNRSYGIDSDIVSKYASLMIKAQNKYNIISVLKHFPGHGSSLGDSHKGFVDISDTYSNKELLPYKTLIEKNMVDAIMTAHVFNKHIDKKYPATLSYNFNTKLLREKMGFDGVIISDDMQMGALAKHYSLEQRVTLSINSGVDITLFGNQLSNIGVRELVEVIFKQVKAGKISLKRIKESNKRIKYLKTKNKIIYKPIIFKTKRKNLTKAYIKKHYEIDAKDIKIVPKIILLHWTAVPNFEDSFKRLYPQELFSDRKDISSASALNVSAHFLIDRDGKIYQLMEDNFMARHVIGLNYNSIGIENVGGESNKIEDLTQAQVLSNIELIKYLKKKYPTIEYLLGHYEYRDMENNMLWLEKDKNYRTKKVDPGEKFMGEVRIGVRELKLKNATK
jgi:beta-N-acetylhexosaminidase